MILTTLFILQAPASSPGACRKEWSQSPLRHKAKEGAGIDAGAGEDNTELCRPDRDIREKEIAVALHHHFVVEPFRIFIGVVRRLAGVEGHQKGARCGRSFNGSNRTLEDGNTRRLLRRVVVEQTPIEGACILRKQKRAGRIAQSIASQGLGFKNGSCRDDTDIGQLRHTGYGFW